MQGRKSDVCMVGNFSRTVLKGPKLRPSRCALGEWLCMLELRTVGCSIAAVNDDPVKCVLPAM